MKKTVCMDDKGQMMALESVLFAITVILALIFLYQLSPPSTVTDKTTVTLKIQGDDALHSLYTESVTIFKPIAPPKGFPKNKLVYYLITNDYKNMTSDLNEKLPFVLYNIYISNGTKTIFWCNSFGTNDSAISFTEKPVTVSHHAVALHHDLMTNYKELYKPENKNVPCEIEKYFSGYTGSTYDLILEMM